MMRNYTCEDGVHYFHVDGGDVRTMKSTLLWLVFVGVLFWGSFLYFSLERWIPSIAWLIICLASMGGVMWILSKGRMSRFLIIIEPGTRVIKAYDQKEQQEMWEDVFYPENLFISNIQVLIGAQA